MKTLLYNTHNPVNYVRKT